MEENTQDQPIVYKILICKISVLFDEVVPDLAELNKTLSDEASLAGGSLTGPAAIDPNGNVIFTLRLPEQNVETFKSNGKVSFGVLSEEYE